MKQELSNKTENTLSALQNTNQIILFPDWLKNDLVTLDENRESLKIRPIQNIISMNRQGLRSFNFLKQKDIPCCPEFIKNGETRKEKENLDIRVETSSQLVIRLPQSPNSDFVLFSDYCYCQRLRYRNFIQLFDAETRRKRIRVLWFKFLLGDKLEEADIQGISLEFLTNFKEEIFCMFGQKTDILNQQKLIRSLQTLQKSYSGNRFTKEQLFKIILNSFFMKLHQETIKENPKNVLTNVYQKYLKPHFSEEDFHKFFGSKKLPKTDYFDCESQAYMRPLRHDFDFLKMLFQSQKLKQEFNFYCDNFLELDMRNYIKEKLLSLWFKQKREMNFFESPEFSQRMIRWLIKNPSSQIPMMSEIIRAHQSLVQFIDCQSSQLK